MSNSAVDIHIMGKLMRLSCPSGEEAALQAAASDLSDRLDELKAKTKAMNLEQLALVTALNLTYELAQERDKNVAYAKTMDQRISLLQQTIEDALTKQNLNVETASQTQGSVSTDATE